MSEKSWRRHRRDTDINDESKVQIRFDSDENTFYAHHDTGRVDSLARAVVQAVAEVAVEETTNMEPLHTVVDVDALDALLNDDGSTTEVTFRYEGWSVSVTSDGEIMLSELERGY